MDRTDLTVIDGDARISDAHIQRALGYGRINDLHRIIRRHEAELAGYGEMLCRTGKASSGQTVITYFLNEPQATLICMFSRTERAAAARKTIVEVFTAWRRGQLGDLTSCAADPFERMAGRASHVSSHLRAISAMPALARDVTHLPVWRNGRRPWWWSDYALRSFLTESHRQMTLAQCIAEAQARFGRAPSMSGLQRYWAVLDGVVGPKAPALPIPTRGAA